MQVDLHFMFVTVYKVAYGLRYDNIYNIYTHSYLYICLCTRFVSCDDCGLFFIWLFDFM